MTFNRLAIASAAERRSARPPLLLRSSFAEVSVGGASKMKVYEGSRTMDGLVVTVDGAPLAEHYEVKQFTKRSFEWTYEGTSPQQLALAILFDYTGDPQRAVALSEPFMKEVVANFDNDWRLTGEQIDEFLRHRRA